MAYDRFPAVDDTYNFPPEVRAALAKSVDLRNTVIPMTQTLRNNLVGTDLWDGRMVLNTTTDRLNRYDAGTTSWIQIPDTPDLDAVVATAKTVSGIRNRIINGAFNINQRSAASGTTLNPNDYFFDRWKATTAGAVTWVADGQGATLTLPAGMTVAQDIENQNMNSGRYALSHTGTAKARVYAVGGVAPAFASTPLIVDLPSPNVDDIRVEFQADGGSSKTVGRVQLEKIGNSGVVADATPFERRLIGAELILCQRFYWRWNLNTPNLWLSPSTAVSSLTARWAVRFPVTMRNAPQALGLSAIADFTNIVGSATLVTLTAVTRHSSTTDGMIISFTGPSASLTIQQAYIAARSATAPSSAWLAFDAEM